MFENRMDRIVEQNAEKNEPRTDTDKEA